LDFRSRIIEKYDGLFGTEQADEFSETAQFGKRWGWYSSIYALSQGDVRRFDEITQLPINQCLTFLSFEKQKNELEIKMINKNR
jgi:hypothetical protein